MLNKLKALCARYDLENTVKFAEGSLLKIYLLSTQKPILLLLSLKRNWLDLTLPAKLQATWLLANL